MTTLRLPAWRLRAPPTIETDRLLLRRPGLDDVGAIFERYASDPEVVRYLSWPRHRDPSDTVGFIELSDAQWKSWPAGPYLITARSDGTILGGTGLAFETPFRASTGYVLARDAWGQGHATEALRAMTKLAGELRVRRLYALCHRDHQASRRVLEKGGFVFEGTLRSHVEFPNLGSGLLSDVACYASILGA